MIKDAVTEDRTSAIFTRLKTMSHIKGIIHNICKTLPVTIMCLKLPLV